MPKKLDSPAFSDVVSGRIRSELKKQLVEGTIFHTRQPHRTQRRKRQAAPFNKEQVEFYEEGTGDSQ